jgi:hypothetical protein
MLVIKFIPTIKKLYKNHTPREVIEPTDLIKCGLITVTVVLQLDLGAFWTDHGQQERMA